MRWRRSGKHHRAEPPIHVEVDAASLRPTRPDLVTLRADVTQAFVFRIFDEYDTVFHQCYDLGEAVSFMLQLIEDGDCHVMLDYTKLTSRELTVAVRPFEMLKDTHDPVWRWGRCTCFRLVPSIPRLM